MNVTIKQLPVTQLATATHNQITLVELVGDIDGNTAPAVQAQILPLAESNTRIILDMTQVAYLSSAGLRMLLSVYRRVIAQNGQVILVGLSEDIKDTMSITGFLSFFSTSDTREAGFALLKVQPSTLFT